MATITSSSSSRSGVRQSPFRETEWDRKLDNLLDDLEHSGGGGGAGSDQPLQHFQSSHQSSSSGQQRNTSTSSSTYVQRQQQQQQSFSSSSSQQQQQQQHLRSQSSSSALRAPHQENNNNGYAVTKSQSSNSLHESADTMLKDLEGSLKASSNFIESHRSVSGPTGTQEYHEYRSFSNGGDGAQQRNGGAGVGDFNLERQVEHMMPPGSMSSFNNGGSSSANTAHGLQSANMVSSMQQSKQSYSSYKVQSNQYNSSGDRITHDNNNAAGPDGDRPGSRLKQNIDELDHLLYDLNNARKMSDAGADYTASSITPGNMSSDDYSFHEGHQGHVKRTTTGYNEYNYTSGTTGTTDYGSRKPPSPSPRRRGPNPSPSQQPNQPLSSPNTVRKLSPGPSSGGPPGSKMISSSYNYSSTTSNTTTGYNPAHPNNNGYPPSSPGPNNGYPSNGNPYPSTSQPSYPSYNPPPKAASPSPYQPEHKSPVPPNDGTPTGVSYYTKYHSTHSHQSQSPGPIAFPTNSTPRLGGRTQAPPKRVDDLMTELSEFDSSIQHTGFVEPADQAPRPTYREPSPVEDFGPRNPSPQRQPKQPSTPGPAVYYPPGEMFSSTKARNDSLQSGSAGGPGQVVVTHTTTLDEGGKGKGKGKYRAKEKGRYQESSSEGGKQGAAVIPICLPFGCAAPCVIM